MSDLNFIDKNKLEKLFRMEGGLVFTLSNRAFRSFVIDSVERDIEDDPYDAISDSKARRLRQFWAIEPNCIVGKLTSDLIEIAKAEDAVDVPSALIEQCEQIAKRLMIKPSTLSSSINGESSGLKTTKDFFISYNSADSSWAEWIAWVLEAQGYSVVIQAWDFRPGGNFILDMQRATTETQRTVMVLSSSYLEALYTQPEWASAFIQDPISSERKILPIRVAPCTLIGMLAPLAYVDFVGKEEETVKALLLAALQERAKPKIMPAFPGQSASIPPVTTFPGDHFSSPHAQSPDIENQSSIPSKKLSSRERLAIIQKLNSLPSPQFKNIMFALKLPNGVISSHSLSQEEQTISLLVWLESPEGIGTGELDEVLEVILSKQSEAGGQTIEQDQGTELVRELIKALNANQGPKYDLRGARFAGGFAETVRGHQIGNLHSNSGEEQNGQTVDSNNRLSTLFPLLKSMSLSEQYITGQLNRSDALEVVSVFPINKGCTSARSNASPILLLDKDEGYWIISKNQEYYLLPGDKDFSDSANYRELTTLYICPQQPDLSLPIRIYELATVKPIGAGEWQLTAQGKLAFTSISLLAQLYNSGQINYSHAQDVVELMANGSHEYSTNQSSVPFASTSRSGKYWILLDDDQHYLAPKTTARLDEHDIELLTAFVTTQAMSKTC